MNKCTGMEAKLADMLLDPESAPAKVKTHVAECDSCRKELEELRATMTVARFVDRAGAEPVLPYPAGCADARRTRSAAARLAGAPARSLCLWSFSARTAAGRYGAHSHAADRRRRIPGSDQPGTAARRQVRPRWFTICRRSTATRSFWISLKQCQTIPTTETRSNKTRSVGAENDERDS